MTENEIGKVVVDASTTLEKKMSIKDFKYFYSLRS